MYLSNKYYAGDSVSLSGNDLSLSNINLVPSFNLVIQALSSCNNFQWRLNKMLVMNTNLEKLNLLNILVNNIDSNENISLSPSQEIILERWNNIEDTTIFEFLTNILNEVYDEIREYNGVINIDSWLQYRLPFRIIMKYEIFCECGYKDLSQGQSELSISVKPNRVGISVQKLVQKYFEKMSIDGKVCDNKHCSIDQGHQIRKFSCPLPETFFVYIERRSTIDKVSLSSELIIKRASCIVDPGKDIHYVLTCVITHSSKMCYKKVKNQWFLISDMLSPISDIDKVQPYILFFEIKELDCIARGSLREIPVSLIDYCVNDCLHNIIQPLSSCQSFVTWLKCLSKENDMKILSAVLMLSKNTSSNTKDEDVVNVEAIKALNQYCGSDIYHVLEILVENLNKEINPKTKNKDQDSRHAPYTFHLSSLIMCGCGSRILTNTESCISLNFKVIEDDVNIEVQELVDEYFQEKEDKKYNCVNRMCAVNNVCRRLVLHHPIPSILCVHLNKLSNSVIKLTEELIIKEEFFSVNDRRNKKSVSNENRLFYLRGAIAADESHCYRKMDHEWFYVDETLTKTVSLDDVLFSHSNILFYENAHFDDEVKFEENDSISKDNEHKDSERKEKVGFSLNSIILSLSSCARFIDWLNYLTCNEDMKEISTLISLLSVVNKILENDNSVDNEILQYWSETGSSLYEATHVILAGVVHDLMKEEPTTKEVTVPIMIYNLCTKSKNKNSFKYIQDIEFSNLSNDREEPQPLQVLIDQCFEIWSGFDELHFKNTTSASKMSINEGLPHTLGFHFEQNWLQNSNNNMVPSMYIIMKNKPCNKSKSCLSEYNSCCKKYFLRSFIDLDGLCYKVMNEKFYKVSECAYVNVDEEEVLTLLPKMIMYESII